MVRLFSIKGRVSAIVLINVVSRLRQPDAKRGHHSGLPLAHTLPRDTGSLFVYQPHPDTANGLHILLLRPELSFGRVQNRAKLP
jgi:hypothetical protein